VQGVKRGTKEEDAMSGPPATLESRRECLACKFGKLPSDLSALRMLIAYELRYLHRRGQVKRFRRLALQYRAFALFYCINAERVYTVQEISQMLGLAHTGHVAQLCHRAANQLSKELYGK